MGLLLCSLFAQGQNPDGPLTEEGQAFPYGWVGIWAGELQIYRGDGLKQSLPMQLHLLPLDSVGQYTWTLIYGPDLEKGRRSYVLKTIDAATGRYLIDERNSIAMEAYFFADKLFSRFSVMDNLLLSTTEMRNGQLVFEIISGSLTAASHTGDTTFEGEEIPPVEAFPIVVMQRAVLSRQ